MPPPAATFLIVADLEDRRVDVEVVGPPALRRSALNIVLNDLEAVHRLNPEAEPVVLVPLPDNPKVEVPDQHLLTLEEEKGPDYLFYPQGKTRNTRFRNSSTASAARLARADKSWRSRSWEISIMYPVKRARSAPMHTLTT